MTDHAIEPMTDPVAPPGRVCATCRWWFGGTLPCPKLHETFKVLLTPPPNFHCNHWQPKEATS